MFLQWLQSCIVFLLLFALYSDANCQQLRGLPPARLIEELAWTYQSSFNIEHSQQRLFPALEFTFRGRIIGWKFAATENVGGARPILSVWSSNATDRYTLSGNVFLDECITSRVQLSTRVAFIHESGPPSPGLTFNRGDILGLFMRPRDTADFVPYLYNGNRQSDINPRPANFYSYILNTQGPRTTDVSLSNIMNGDRLLPLMALELCSLEGVINGVPRCNGKTLLKRSQECVISTTTTTSGTTTMIEATTTITTNTAIAPTYDDENGIFSDLMLIIITAVPTTILFLFVVVTLVLILLYCMRRRKRFTYTTNNVLPENHSTVTTKNYNLSAQVEYDRIDPMSAANYEEPLTMSHDNSTFGFGTSLSQVTSHSISPRPSTPGHYTNSPTQPKNYTNMQFYHTLIQENSIRNEASLLFPLNSNSLDIGNTSPLVSPGGSFNLSRKHLHSNENLTFRKVSPGVVPESSKESSLAERFFRLETGVYVPTQEQRNHLTIESQFDYGSYITLSEVPNSPSVNNWNFFEECESYWKPATDPSILYSQLSSQKYREIHRKQIEFKEHLGSGEFGTVCRGIWHTEQGNLDTAVKMLNRQSSKDRVRFLQEAAIVGQFKHPNIVRLHGVVTLGEPVMIVLELVQNGDLRKYLRSLRPVPGKLVPHDLPEKLLNFGSQIALGMEYLARKEFVHRDLAARNILLTEDYICKIADFGMSRDLDDDNYYISSGGKIPIKWTAPEALHYRKYSTATDVWSFGVLLYEIWSLGRTPFMDKSPEQTIVLIESGNRLAPPPGCPIEIYKIMIQCWNPNAYHRPSFTKLLHALSQPMNLLLRWSKEDLDTHPQASVLGSSLEVAANLYPDLQNTFKHAKT